MTCRGKPGSVDARAQGCTCPRMDNAEGHNRLVWVAGDCPVHGKMYAEPEAASGSGEVGD